MKEAEAGGDGRAAASRPKKRLGDGDDVVATTTMTERGR